MFEMAHRLVQVAHSMGQESQRPVRADVQQHDARDRLQSGVLFLSRRHVAFLNSEQRETNISYGEAVSERRRCDHGLAESRGILEAACIAANSGCRRQSQGFSRSGKPGQTQRSPAPLLHLLVDDGSASIEVAYLML